nr:hypothetical protein ECPA41_3525 [Escherichia coli PA41]
MYLEHGAHKYQPLLKSRFAVNCHFWPLPAVKNHYSRHLVIIMNACRVS